MANSKDVVVTGVSTGIGWGTTKVLVAKGFRVFGSVRKQADADRLQTEFGDGFVPLLMDITDADAVLRTGLCLDFFLRECSTPSLQSCLGSQSGSAGRLPTRHGAERAPIGRKVSPVFWRLTSDL